jgi:hypothetical protein
MYHQELRPKSYEMKNVSLTKKYTSVKIFKQEGRTINELLG